MTCSAENRPIPTLPIPDIRDYERINAELVQWLDTGHAHIRLAGAEGQRLLVAGLVGAWSAVVEVEGRAGPELAAGMDAPGLTVVCRGPAADGAARSLRAGRVLILGNAGPSIGYAQAGGVILAARGVGPRAGLNQKGGVLILLGPVGQLAGERQSGGVVFAHVDRLGPHASRGQRGGRFIRLPAVGDPPDLEGEEASLLQSLMSELAPLIACDSAHQPGSW